MLTLGAALASCHPGDAKRERRTRSAAPLTVLAGDVELPPDHELAAQLADAVEFRQRSDYDRILDALEPGEGLEHATLTQAAIDRGIFGPDALFVVGDELFEYEFRPRDGLGNGLARRPGVRAGQGPHPNMRRVHRGSFGGPDSYSCATCHSKGGPDGAGTATQNAFLRGDGDDALTADERNPPHLLGLGPIEALAREMTRELGALRDAALAEAAQTDAPISAPLMSKGVSFGVLVAHPDGSVDSEEVTGVASDLIVRPFGWKGHQASLRAMVEESFRIHLGVVSIREQALVAAGELPRADYGDGDELDVDRDGVALEIDEGMLTTMVAYLSQLEVPVVAPPRDPNLLDLHGRGRILFTEIGCGECHRPELVLDSSVLELRPAEARLADREPIRIDVARDGESPKIDPVDASGRAHRVKLFSDLRRHDMGPVLATDFPEGDIPASVFLTRPLWGLADTAPYLHDGRAVTVHDAVALHGGEARRARDLYLALDEDERSALLVFLLSLTREAKLFVP